MKTKIMLVAAAGLVAVITLLGCKKKEEPAVPPSKTTIEEMTKTVTKAAEEVKEMAKEAAVEIEQTMCPVMEGAIDKNIFKEYQGKKVYFCCPDCKAKFEEDPEKYIAKLPQFQK